MTILETAIEYHKHGLQPLALHPKSKVPVVKSWQQWSFKRLTRQEVVKMFQGKPDYNIGIITGEASGIMVVDLDIKHAIDDADLYLQALEGSKEWIDSSRSPLIAQTGTDGYHVFFKYVQGTKNRADIFREAPRAYKVDIRSERGFVVAAPSIHDKTGKQYRWIKKDLDFAQSLKNLTRPSSEIIKASYEAVGSARPSISWNRNFSEIGVGARNTTFAEIVGSLLARYEPTMWDSFCWPMARAWSHTYTKPVMDDAECFQTFKSIASAEATKRAVKSSYAVRF